MAQIGFEYLRLRHLGLARTVGRWLQNSYCRKWPNEKHPAATAATRKRILRTALNEIVVRREGQSTKGRGRQVHFSPNCDKRSGVVQSSVI
jgi:hypothetical protein